MTGDSILTRLRQWVSRTRAGRLLHPRTLLSGVLEETWPLDLRIVGRTLFHAAAVGVAAGLLGALFFAALESLQRVLLEGLTGYKALRAHGEAFLPEAEASRFRPWLLVILPALGGLACGLITRWAPETRGGGGDAVIDAFHNHNGQVRPRVIGVKMLASLCTLGTGGAGGREGPTMQIGGALGAWIASLLSVSARERRILMVAGVAAGLSAVFRTPLGAALLAVEFLYRDGFEAEALVPSVLSSVVAYSVVISIYGESTLFTHAQRFPFVPEHLPLYGVLAMLVAGLAVLFVAALKWSHKLFSALPVPDWMRPCLGGLLVGALAAPLVVVIGAGVGTEGQGLGILGGGYGAAQMAISGADWLPGAWGAVQLLALLSVAKLIAASFTIGSEGSAGDFAPSLAIGGLFGGAFGRFAQILFSDPRIDPGAFALVGMGVFYGGIAHVPLAALILVCELAGNYDLLVPLMLAQGVAFVALRRRTLYPSQPATLHDSPVHREALLIDTLQGLRVKDWMTGGRSIVTFSPETSLPVMLARLREATWQDVFPVLDSKGSLAGLVISDSLHALASEGRDSTWAIAADMMASPVTLSADDDLHKATRCFLAHGLRQLPVVDEAGTITGLLDEHELAGIYLQGRRAQEPDATRHQTPPSEA